MLRSGTVRNTMLHENVFTNRAADFTNMINRPLDVVQLRLKAVGGGDVLRLDRLELIFFYLAQYACGQTNAYQAGT